MFEVNEFFNYIIVLGYLFNNIKKNFKIKDICIGFYIVIFVDIKLFWIENGRRGLRDRLLVLGIRVL